MTCPLSNNPAEAYRNKNGGSLLFRPVGQRPFVINAINAYDKIGGFTDVMQKMNSLVWDMNSELWTYIVWNPLTKKMIASSNATTIFLLIKYLLNVEALSKKEQNELVALYRGAKKFEDMDDNMVWEMINKYRLS